MQKNVRSAIVLFYLFHTSMVVSGQDINNRSWLVSTEFSLQKHDKRLFDFPSKANLLYRQQELYGTYQVSLSLLRKLNQNHIFIFYSGLGISSELNTFHRPFDHNYGKGGGSEPLTYTDRYYKYLVQLPF